MKKDVMAVLCCPLAQDSVPGGLHPSSCHPLLLPPHCNAHPPIQIAHQAFLAFDRLPLSHPCQHH